MDAVAGGHRGRIEWRREGEWLFDFASAGFVIDEWVVGWLCRFRDAAADVLRVGVTADGDDALCVGRPGTRMRDHVRMPDTLMTNVEVVVSL